MLWTFQVEKHKESDRHAGFDATQKVQLTSWPKSSSSKSREQAASRYSDSKA